MSILAMFALVTFTCGTNLNVLAESAPDYVNYQGKLTDAKGAPLATGDYILEFNIYSHPDALEADKLAWGPQVFDGAKTLGHGTTVSLVNGFFNVILGPKDTANRSLKDAFVAGESRYLGIKVNNGIEITPRMRILSAPYALESYHAEYATHGVPVGTVVPYAGTSAPFGWALCDGASLPTSGTAARLHGVIGFTFGEDEGKFKVPDLRGRFPLGIGGGPGLTARNIAAAGGAEKHTLTTEEMPSHNHSINDPGHNHKIKMGEGDAGSRDRPADGDNYDDNDYYSSEATTGITINNTGNNKAHNNMPPFLGLNFIIKL